MKPNPNKILKENPELIHQDDMYIVLGLTKSGFYKRKERGHIKFEPATKGYYRTKDVREYLKLDQ